MLSVKNFCAKSISGAGTNVYFNQNKLSLFHKTSTKNEDFLLKLCQVTAGSRQSFNVSLMFQSIPASIIT